LNYFNVFRIYRFIGSTVRLIEGLFDEVTGCDGTVCDETVCDETVCDETVCDDTVGIRRIVGWAGCWTVCWTVLMDCLTMKQRTQLPI
jgi:hypothetical protein